MSFLGNNMSIYYADQNNCKIRLLQTGDYKKYKLSKIKSDEGEIKAIINFPFFSSSLVVGRYQGDEFDNRVDQTNFKGNNIVITTDNQWHIGEYNGWDYCNINEVLAGFCPSAVLLKGKELEISDTIVEQKQWSKNSKVNRTALVYDTEYHFAVAENLTVDEFLSELKNKYTNYEFIALGDSGGSSELIVDGVIQNNLSDGEERPNFCGLAFIKTGNNKKLFCPRYSKDGMKNDKYWYDNSYNAGSNGDAALPNCVTYCSGRLSEANGENLRNIMSGRTGFGNAKEWYDSTTLEKGSTPKVGAIACFTGTLGHVAFVEKVNDDGTVTVSQSNYQSSKDYSSSNYFQVKTYKLVVGQIASGVGLVFQGYIYSPNIKTSVNRDTSKDQIEVLVERLKVRKSANGDWNEGIFAPLGIYDILEVKTEGEYTWAKLDDECWIAINDVDGWTKTYMKEEKKPEPTTDYETLYKEEVEKYNMLETKYETLETNYQTTEAQNKSYSTEIDNLKEENKKLSEKLAEIKKIVS